MARYGHEQETVLITGASAGIGAEFARQLVRRGSDLVLVARRADRLELLAGQLRAECGATVTTLAMDLARPDVGAALLAAVAERDVTVTSVINNAGFANLGPFHEQALGDLAQEMRLDTGSVVEISHAFLPAMRDRGAGYLINVASAAAYQAAPTMAVYGASKAFVLSLTEALWYESRGTGVRVLALSPGATATEFFDVAGDSADGGSRRMTPTQVVETALRTLDRRNPPPSVVVGRANRLSAVATRLVSRRRATMLVGSVMTASDRAATSRPKAGQH